MKNGQVLSEKDKILHEIVSKPPARFTQATLISAMENVQKYMAADEVDLKNAMKKAGGIGQPSSRAAIISDLVNTAYIKDVTSGKNKGLYITDSGKKYIENLGNSSIVSPELSAEWEVHMTHIREGSEAYDDVYEEIINYVYDALEELNNMQIEKTTDRKEVGVCPICGKPVVELPKGWGCSGYPECHFSIYKTIAGVDLTEKQVMTLLAGQTTEVISGFKSKSGKTFSAALTLQEDGKVTWAPFESKTDLKCPKCGKPLVKTPMSYKCEDDGCGFILWNSICGKTLTEEQVKKLLAGETTDVIKGFKKKDGSKFDAALQIKDGKLTWAMGAAKDTGLKCPKCGKPIVESSKAFACSGNKGRDKADSTCDFIIWKNVCGKDLSAKDVKDLLTKKKTGLKKNLQSKAGNSFDAYVVMKDDFTTGLEFPEKK